MGAEDPDHPMAFIKHDFFKAASEVPMNDPRTILKPDLMIFLENKAEYVAQPVTS
jgi:hypothetical protein